MNRLLSASALLLALIILAASCKTQKRSPEFLTNAEEIARQTNGFYLRMTDVTIEKGMENGQNRLAFVMRDGNPKAKKINVYLEKEDADQTRIASGKYEVLFMNQIVILRNPLTREQHTFQVNNKEVNKVRRILPAGYLPKQPTAAIGIAVYGDKISPLNKS